jgi:hypothetical protein
MIDLNRLRSLRDEMADMVEDPLHGLTAEVGDRGIDLNERTAEFEMQLPDGSYYNVQVRSVS